MTVIAENGKGPAGSQTYELAVPGGALTLLRVLAWPPASEAAGTRLRVSPAGDEPRCLALLETIVDLLQTLLASTAGGTERLSETRLVEVEVPCVRLAGEYYGLTAREKQVLAEMAEGKSNRQIANSLAVSVSTAKSHVSNILSKMGAESRTAAVALALQQPGKSGCGQKESGATFKADNPSPLSH